MDSTTASLRSKLPSCSHRLSSGSRCSESVQLLQQLLVALQSYCAQLSKLELQSADALRDMAKHLESTQKNCFDQVQTWTYRERMAFNEANEEVALAADFRRKGYERSLVLIEEHLPLLRQAILELPL